MGKKNISLDSRYYDLIHDATPHREISDFKPIRKPIIAYKQFKMSLDKNGNNISKGYLYPLYVNTADTNTDGGLKIGVWYKSGTGKCWQSKRADKDGKKRFYTVGSGYGVNGEKTLNRLAYRSGWHLTSNPWGNQRGANGVTNKYRNTNDIEVWAEVEICVDNDKTEEAKKNGTIPRDQCFSEIPDDSFYKYKTNPNATDFQDWYIADKMRIIRVLSDDEVDRLNDEYYSNIASQGYNVYDDPDFDVPKKKKSKKGKPVDIQPKDTYIPYWKMPRVNGKRYSKEELGDMGYNDVDPTEIEEILRRISGMLLREELCRYL